jgi:hypothetical protein
MAAIKPGNFSSNPADVSGFVDSMADAMDRELNALLVMDGLKALSTSNSDREVRARRRMFIAIARGVVGHLATRPEAFGLTLPGSGSVTVRLDDIDTTG